MDKEYVKHKLKHNGERLFIVLKWVIFSILSGILIGIIGAVFSLLLKDVTNLRGAHPQIVFALPLGGLVIVFCYKLFHNEKDSGTNLILSAIHSGDHVPLRMAPSIFISTILTHLFGGSAGREGAALQLGGSIGGSLGKVFRLNEKDQHIMMMCGMSAAFSTLFGTPLAAAIFSMEVVSVGIMHYSALVPCVIASLVAREVANLFGVSGDQFLLSTIPTFQLKSAAMIALLAILAALVSILFCVALHTSAHFFQKIKNPYFRIFLGGALVLFLTLLVGDQTYNGAGLNVIEQCFSGNVFPLAFLLKIIFTAVTIGSGYKGGEIVPTFFIGASFGALFAMISGMDTGLCTAVGMTAVFCGVTNCPITSLLISFELFGFQGRAYFLLAVAISYALSGYFGLYSSQKIVYSKYKTNFINKHTH